jgi:FAD/FMN-containing dehydrogenase
MNTSRKNNTGIDLKQLFIGSEGKFFHKKRKKEKEKIIKKGTLGIITKAAIHCPSRPKF